MTLLPNIDLFSFLNTFDLSIVLLSALSFLIIPHFCNQKKLGQDKEYLLMSRSLSLPLFVATLTATWYGGIFGVTQIAFQNGFYGFFTQGLFWYISYLIFAFFFAKKIRQKKVLSLPELIGDRFGQRARHFSAILLFFHSLPVTYSLSIAILIQMIFGINFSLALIFGVGLVGVYTALGGFRGVVVTDALQFILMFSAVLLCLSFLFYHFGFMSFLQAALPKSYFDWRGDHSISSSLVWLFIACSTTLIHPVFYQRCLAARSDSVAFYGILIAVFCWFIFDCCTTLGGMYAKALLPDAPSERAYVYMAIQLMPHGLRGLFLAGIMATIISTLDSFLFVSGTSLSYDLLPNRQGTRRHQAGILLSASLVIAIALLFDTNFEQTWLFMEGIFSTALVVPVLAAIFIKRPLAPRNFFAPALAALVVFCSGSLWRHFKDPSFVPFYWAHQAALLAFLITSPKLLSASLFIRNQKYIR
jgi:SSS family solute:Na+ symporter